MKRREMFKLPLLVAGSAAASLLVAAARPPENAKPTARPCSSSPRRPRTPSPWKTN